MLILYLVLATNAGKTPSLMRVYLRIWVTGVGLCGSARISGAGQMLNLGLDRFWLRIIMIWFDFKQSYQILDGHTIFSFVGNLFFSNESWIMTHDSQYLGIAPVLAKTLSIRKDKPRPSRRARNNRIFRTTAKREGTRLAYRVVLYHFYSFPITVSTNNTLMCKFIKLKECFSDVVPCFPIRVYRKGAF